MALLGNYSVILKNPATFIGGTQVSNCRSAFGGSGQNLQMYYGESDRGGLPLTASLPTGTQPPYSYHLAEKGGELSASTNLKGISALSGSMILTKPFESTLSGVGTLEGSLALLTTMAANLAGSGALSASLSQLLSMAANLSGTGELTPSMGLLVNMITELAGSGTVDGDLKGVARLEATIYVNQSEATVQQIVDAVWNAIAAQYNLTGTMGEALNGAGAAGNPWITDLSGYTTANTAGKILKDAADSAELASIK